MSIPEERYVDITRPGSSTGGVPAEIRELQRRLDAHIGKGGNAHAIATPEEAGFMSQSDKEKLDTVQNGATQNQTDDYLLNLTNATGELPIARVDGLQEEIDRISGDSAAQLREDLANDVEGNLGAHLVAFPAPEGESWNVADLASPDKGAAMVSYRGRSVDSKLAESVSLYDYGVIGDGLADDTDALIAAIEGADQSGHLLDWLDAEIRVTRSVQVSVDLLNWRSDGAVVVIDTPGDVVYGLLVTVSERPGHRVLGSGLTIDGRGKCHIGHRVLQPVGSQTATLYTENVGAVNVELTVAASQGGAGYSVRGGFQKVELVRPKVSNVALRAGAGIPTSKGINGIQVMNHPGTSGAYTKRIEIIYPEVDRVYSLDPAYDMDMDGIGVFANPVVDSTFGPSSALIVKPKISRCWGRDVKMQVGSSRVEYPESYVTEGPSGGVSQGTYDFQYGPGELIGGEYFISNVVKTAPTCRFANPTEGNVGQSIWQGGVVEVAPSATVTNLFSSTGSGVGGMSTASAEGVTVRGSIDHFGEFRINTYLRDSMHLDRISVDEIRTCLVTMLTRPDGSAPYEGHVQVIGCTNLSEVKVPIIRHRIPGFVANAVLSSDGNTGFLFDYRFVQSRETYSGGAIVSRRVPEAITANRQSGSELLLSAYLASGDSVLLPEHGYDTSCYVEIKASFGRGSIAQIVYDIGGIETIYAGSSFSVGNANEPADGNFRVWLDGGRIRLKNMQGSPRAMIIRMLG